MLVALRGLRTDLPIVLSSGFGEQEASERCLEAGRSGVGQKPYQVGTRQSKPREVLSRRARGAV